jgi:uncharacterized protein (TIGR00304 family)
LDTETLYILGITLAFAGIIIITVAVLLTHARKSEKTAKVRGGGAIIMGPIPIVFGSDRESLITILILSIIFTAFLIALAIMLHLTSK